MRRRLSDLLTFAIVVVPIVVLALVAWVSRHPDAAWIERAESWPLLDRVASRFRARYVEPTAAVAADPAFDVRHRSEVDSRPAALAPAPIVEALSPPFGDEPLPTVRVAARKADERRLQEARDAFSGEYRQAALGAYTLLTDLPEELVVRLAARAMTLESSYVERYGLTPIGVAAETVVLFRHEADYRRLLESWRTIRSLPASGHAGFGLVVTFLGERRESEIAATLVHELVHLLNRRAVGPALPPWLDEGMADDLSHSQVDSAGRILAGSIAVERRRQGDRFELRGTLASLSQLNGEGVDAAAGLPALLHLDHRDFAAAKVVGVHYSEAELFVRCLLDSRCGEGSAAAFRAYLQAVSGGASAAPETLERLLGQPWPVTDARWRFYLGELAVAYEVTAGEIKPAAPGC